MSVRPYIVGNWKMHGTRAMLSEARAIDRAAERLMKVEVALAPPYTLIHATR
jgi:triosephosphate isomerase